MVSAGPYGLAKNICIFSGLGEDLAYEKERARYTNGRGLTLREGHL